MFISKYWFNKIWYQYQISNYERLPAQIIFQERRAIDEDQIAILCKCSEFFEIPITKLGHGCYDGFNAIFGALDALNPGEAMRFVNDHDPLPLLNQMQQRYGERIKVIYQQREPGAIMIDFVVLA